MERLKRPEEEVDDELQFHIEARVREYIARGMTPEAARRAAVERFGDTARVRDACASMLASDRAARERRIRLSVSWLDVKLGVRMLVKYPGLSAVAVIGMALAIAIGAGYFTVLGAILDLPLALPEGDRVVAIRESSAPNFVQWRNELTSIAELSAFTEDNRNLITADGGVQIARIAVMTPSGFALTRTPARLGRPLLPDDARADAAPVLVIGYKEWQRRFGGDPGILGTTVRLDETVHTIVGVMPEGFGFPLGHQYWVPLLVTEATPMPGVEVEVFGRLAPGVTLAQARAELAAIADRKAAASAQSPRPERPQLSAYNQAFIGIRGPEMELAVRAIRIGIGLLVLIVAVNVAILVYARTATRSGEIAVRTALGASRARVVAQLFVEALVMSVAAAALGLTVAGTALRVFRDYVSQDTDKGGWAAGFATAFHLSPSVVLYVAVLAILAAIVVGVIPALQATGRRVHAGLQQFSARGSGMQLGRTWTALIVMQVAIAVAALPAAMYRAEGSFSNGMRAPSPVAANLLAGRLSMSGSGTTTPLHAARITALLERIASEPDVAGVTFAAAFPGHEAWGTMEAEGDGRSVPIDVHWNRVAINCFDVLGVRILAGRGFDVADARHFPAGRADARPAASAVIVDQSFAQQLAPGASVIGRRIRFTRPDQDAGVTVNPWSEIVGVVPAFTQSFTAPMGFGDPLPRVYYAAAAGAEPRASLIVRLKSGSTGSPAQVAQRLSETAAGVHPSLKLENVEGVVQVWEHDQEATRLVAVAIIAVTASVLLLSAAGIYSMMSFTVARRRREIGIRAALGADARRVLMGIFGRASVQLGAGTLAGLAIAVGLDRLDPGSMMGDRALVLLPSVVAVMFVVGLLAALGPARRGLSVQPTEALREE